MQHPFVVIGGGIAGVTCTQTLAELCPTEQIVLVAASKLIKTVTNFQKMSRTLEHFDVEEKDGSVMELDCPNVKVVHKKVDSLDTDKHVLTAIDGTLIHYRMLCICTGGTPKVIAAENPYVIGIRDTESVQEFQKRLRKARRIFVVGNGGIATELVYEVEGCEVIWAIKHKSVTSTFFDAGAAAFCLPHLNKEKAISNEPLKRHKYMEEDVQDNNEFKCYRGSALGPDWTADLEMKGAETVYHRVHVEYEVEVKEILTPEEFMHSGKCETCQPSLMHLDPSDRWPVYVELTNDTIYGCDFIVSATGVTPGLEPFLQNKFDIATDGGVRVNSKMQTSQPDVFAAGDVCSASWDVAPLWIQIRLWSQARQMGAYAAKCMVAQYQGLDIAMDFCFEMFSHITSFFNYKVILLGKFNAQGLGSDCEILLRVTKDKEYVKAVLHDNKLVGAVLIGETDLEETFENLILNQTDLTQFKEHLLDPNIDIEDFFD